MAFRGIFCSLLRYWRDSAGRGHEYVPSTPSFRVVPILGASQEKAEVDLLANILLLGRVVDHLEMDRPAPPPALPAKGALTRAVCTVCPVRGRTTDSRTASYPTPIRLRAPTRSPSITTVPRGRIWTLMTRTLTSPIEVKSR